MSGEALKSVVANSGTVASAAATSRHVSVEARRRLVAESLQVGNPGNKSKDLPDQADPLHDCQIELAVDDIRPYENNPRRVSNTRFAQIKESVRASGIRNPLTVTRRPGEAHFIVEAGGNTRLLAIQQLWAETRDARFRRLMVLFRPWRGESNVLTAHLIENELRGEMTFWDKASGVVALKARLEAEQGHALSLRQLEDAMKALGLSVNTATLALYLFAVGRLRTLGEAIAELSGLDVKTMQPRLNVMKRYAQTRASLAEDDLYAMVFEPVFRQAAEQYRASRRFSALSVCRACEEALARKLDEPVTAVRAAQPSARPTSAVSTSDAGNIVSGRHLGEGGEIRVADEFPVMLARLIEQVTCIAGLAGIEDGLRFDDAAPLGYYMDGLSIPVDGDPPSPIRQRAWWLLALASGQCDASVMAAVPEGFTADGSGNLDAAAGRMQVNLPVAISFDNAFFDWLVDARDEMANACWNALTLVRVLRHLTPKRHGKDFPLSASGGQ